MNWRTIIASFPHSAFLLPSKKGFCFPEKKTSRLDKNMVSDIRLLYKGAYTGIVDGKTEKVYANSPEEAEALLQELTFEGDDEGTAVYHIRCNNSFGTILTYSEDIIDEADAESGDLLLR